MRVFFTGATGAIGREAVPRLLEAGHEVRAVARDLKGRDWLSGIGAEPVSVDLFDREMVARALIGAEAVFHFATAIPSLDTMTKRTAWEMNDRLRSRATRYLVDGAIAAGAGRFIQESITFFYGDGGMRWLDESAPIAPVWDVLDSALDAESHAQRFASSGGTAVVMRLARLYGPDRASTQLIQGVAAGKVPIIGDGRNLVSSLHSEDAGRALAAALSAPGGVYNVADDEPVGSADLLRALAERLDARPPQRVPPSVARLVGGRFTRLLTVSHRILSKRFRDSTGWSPLYRSVVDGWEETVAKITGLNRTTD
jgi:nucleoside-diphosphate-sugar epimerase